MLLSNSCLVLPAVVKQHQEEISRNYIPSLFVIFVFLICFRVGVLDLGSGASSKVRVALLGHGRQYFPVPIQNLKIESKQ